MDVLQAATTPDEAAAADKAARVAANHIGNHNTRLDKSLRALQSDNYAKPIAKLRSIQRKGARTQGHVEAANNSLQDAQSNIRTLIGGLQGTDQLLAGLVGNAAGAAAES